MYSIASALLEKDMDTHTVLSPRDKNLANLSFLAAVFLFGSVGEEAAADDLVIFTHPHLLSSSSSRFLFLPPPVFTSLPFVSSFFPRVGERKLPLRKKGKFFCGEGVGEKPDEPRAQ